MRSAIVLAGGPSRRLGRSKAFVRLAGVPMLRRVVEAAQTVVDEVVVVTKPPSRERVGRTVPGGVDVVLDDSPIQSPLVGALGGATAARGAFAAYLACDTPCLRPPLLALLFRRAKGHDAAVPRWPDGLVEPMVAVYRRTALAAACRDALAAGERSNQAMLRRLEDVVHVPTETLRGADPDLVSFLNVNAPEDVKAARRVLAAATRRRGGDGPRRTR
jgi:molybdopterin-guanine dinucleotide biosynthesis protein A